MSHTLSEQQQQERQRQQQAGQSEQGGSEERDSGSRSAQSSSAHTGRQETSGSRGAARSDKRPTADRPEFHAFTAEERDGLSQRWKEAQSGFVDDPRESVSEVDTLLKEAVDTLAQRIGEQREQLRRDWNQSDGVGTEELRQAMRRYRSLFDQTVRG